MLELHLLLGCSDRMVMDIRVQIATKAFSESMEFIIEYILLLFVNCVLYILLLVKFTNKIQTFHRTSF